MIKLLKYELKKKYKTYLVIFITFFIFNVFFRLTNNVLNLSDLKGSFLSFALTTVFSFSLTIIAMVSVVNNLRLEMKNPTRDLYFSLPISSYTKLGSKVIISFFEIAAAMIIGLITSYSFFDNMFGDFMGAVGTEMPMDKMIQVMLEGFVRSLSFSMLMLLLIYFMIVFYRAFLSQVKFGKVISFIVYFAILFITLRFPINYLGRTFRNQAYLYSASITGISIGLFVITGYLLDKKTSFD